MASHSRTRTSARDDDSWGRDRARDDRSTSITSSARARRQEYTRSRSRSRSRSPKRQRRQLGGREEEEGRYRDRDRDRDRHHHRHHHRHDSHSHSHRRHHPHQHDDHLKREESSSHRRREGESHSHRQRKEEPSRHLQSETSPTLPFNSRLLSRKADEKTFEPLFAYYLDLHKSLDISALPVDEVRGRWKSFVNKWNKSELAEGWYDPELFQRLSLEWKDNAAAGEIFVTEAQRGVVTSAGREKDGGEDEDEFGRVRRRLDSHSEDDGRGERFKEESMSPAGKNYDENLATEGRNQVQSGTEEDDEDDDDYGPALPPTQRRTGLSGSHKHGAEAPSLQDLTLRQESAIEARESEIEALRHARKADRKLQKERLDEILPRAEAGTRERKLEKKKLVNEKMKGFRERSPGAAEVPEEDLLGAGEDSLEEQKRRLKIHEIKVSERQLRMEEMERARAVEREQRIREFKEREEKAVSRLRELARRRFGAGGS